MNTDRTARKQLSLENSECWPGLGLLFYKSTVQFEVNSVA